MIQIAPSILSADFARIGEAVKLVEDAGADLIHVDIMDGHFVPNITIGPVVVESIRKTTKLPLDVHLMISEPDRFLEAFAQAGANALTVHIETCPHIHRTLQGIHELGLRAGVAVNPGTPVDDIRDIIQDTDIVLMMSVNPGFGGQSFIEHSVERIRQARQMLDEAKSAADLSVDGGIGPETAARVVKAGATVLVAGNSIFRATMDISTAMMAIRQAAHAP